MRTYNEDQEVVGTVWPYCWYIVDGRLEQPSVIMDVSEWRRRTNARRITYCDVFARGLAKRR